MTPKTRCLECGKGIRQKGRGRPRLYCEGACADAVHKRQTAEHKKRHPPQPCPVCGKLMKGLIRP